MNAQLRDFLLQNLDFAIEYISLHYPFTEEQAIKHWDYLIKGDAFYPYTINDRSTFWGDIIEPQIGLSFNKNLAWTNQLRERWQNDNQHQTKNLNQLIPLDLDRMLRTVDGLEFQQFLIEYDNLRDWDDFKSFNSTWEDEYMVAYPILAKNELAMLYERSSASLLINPSIWENSLRDFFTHDMIEFLIQTKKERTEQAEQGTLSPLKLDFYDNVKLTPEEEAALGTNISKSDMPDGRK